METKFHAVSFYILVQSFWQLTRHPVVTTYWRQGVNVTITTSQKYYDVCEIDFTAWRKKMEKDVDQFFRLDIPKSELN